MLWIVFSVLSAIIFAATNVIDKFVMSKWVKNPIIPMLVLGLVSIPVVLLIYFFHGFSELSSFNVFVVLLAGAFFALSNLLYFKLVKIEDVSVVIPLFYFDPLFVLVIASVFLGETFTLLKYAGIFLLVFGAMLISFKGSVNLRSRKFLFPLFVCVLFCAIQTVLVKFVLDFADVWTVFSIERIGMLVVLFPFYFLNFSDLVKTAEEHGRKAIALISFSECLGLTGYFFLTLALSYGFASLVSAMLSVQPFFVLFFTVLISFFYPSILKEDISRKTVFFKLLAITLMFLGAVLIA
ncbi:MAG: EamA family transporter [archaeon]